jgi:hypothetical protein
MAKRLDPDIRAFAETIQTRRDEAAGRVKAGEIPHLNFIPQDEREQRARENLDRAFQTDDLRHLADAAAYGLTVVPLPAVGGGEGEQG